MTRRPVRITKVRQTRSAEKAVRAGVPYNGANFVAQKVESTKKAARRTAKPRRQTG